MLQAIFPLFPPSLSEKLSRLPPPMVESLEEIRVRENRPLEIVFQGQYRFVTEEGIPVQDPKKAYCPSSMECRNLLDRISDHSLYTLEEELRRGFITVRGGFRIGITGKAVLENGKVKLLKDISGFNIRIAREIKGAAQQVLPYLMDFSEKTVHPTLFISPPQQGKTTVVRDLARMISSGCWAANVQWPGLKVGIVDERSELAACYKGVPLFDVGPRTDVLDGCPKAEGMMMMIRSMSPDVIIVDEIGREEDAEALLEAARAGIRVIATAHGNHPKSLAQRPIFRKIFETGIFSRYVVLGRRYKSGRVDQIFDQHFRLVGPRLFSATVEEYP